MPKFITTIDLPKASESDLENLHKELFNHSFKWELHAAKSKSYINDQEVFSIEGNVTLQEVNHLVLNAIGKVSKECSFFVMKDKRGSDLNSN
jgi:hypothetical protein